MRKGFLMLMAIVFAMPSYAATEKIVIDSMPAQKNYSFRVLCSAKPILNWMHSTDSASNFLLSNSQVEAQYHYKKHSLGLGFNFNHRKTTNYINNLPNTINRNYLAFCPYYSFQIYKQKRWTGFAGAGYLISTNKTVNTVVSPIETVTDKTITTQEGAQIFLRLNYRLNKRWSLEFETALYKTRTRFEVYEDYPLTPSMNYYNAFFQDDITYSVPSNLWLKFAF